jgi:hypothetical protein
MTFQRSTKSLKNYFGLVMAFVYLLSGILFLFTPTFEEVFPENRNTIGIVLLAYALFRFYISLKRKKS